MLPAHGSDGRNREKAKRRLVAATNHIARVFVRARSSAKVMRLKRRLLPYDQSKRKRRRKTTESTKWFVPKWGQPHGFEDLAIDPDTGRLYASSANMNTILVFDLQGNRIGTLAPTPPDKLDGPSALALAKDKLFILNATSARVSLIDLQKR